MNNTNLAATATNLLNDITTLFDAYKFTNDTTKTHLAERTKGEVSHHVTASDAAWVHHRFGRDAAAYLKLLDDILAKRRDHGNTLLGMSDFYDIEPCPEAKRLLDRINLAFNLIRQQLDTPLPYELRGSDRTDSFSITNGSWEQREFIERSLAFAQAAADVLAPKVSVTL